MQKRMTLLRKRPDLSTDAFRQHWAVPHAEIAKGFTGLEQYLQNRITQTCWHTGTTSFAIDGIVELWFTSPQAVAENAVSDTTKALIVDEPRFLSGLTALTAGESQISNPDFAGQKYMILAQCDTPEHLIRQLKTVLAAQNGISFDFDLLTLSFVREALSAEPVPPNMALSIWQDRPDDARGLITGDQSVLRNLFADEANMACAYAIDALRIV